MAITVSGTTPTPRVAQNTMGTHDTSSNPALLITPLALENLSSTKIKELHITNRGASSNSCMIHAMLGRSFGYSTATQLRDAISTKLMDWLDFSKEPINYEAEQERESALLCRGYYLQMLLEITPILREIESFGDQANTAEFRGLFEGNESVLEMVKALSMQITKSNEIVAKKKLISELKSIEALDHGECQSLYDSLETLAEQEIENAINLREQLDTPSPQQERIKSIAEELCSTLKGQIPTDIDPDQALMNCLTDKDIVNRICKTMIGQTGKGKFLHATFAPLIHLAVNKVLYDDMKKQDGVCEFNSIYDRREGDTQEDGVAWLHDMQNIYNVTHLPTLVIYSPGSGHNEYDRATCILGTTQQADPGNEALETQDTNDLKDLALLFSSAETRLDLYTNAANEISNRRFNGAATTTPIRRLFINGNRGNHYDQLTEHRSQTSQNWKHILGSIATIVGSIFAHKHIALISLKLGVSVAILSTCIHVLATLAAMYLFNKIHQAHSIS